MEHVEENKTLDDWEFDDSTHQREHIPAQVHAVHERPRNSARVRLRVRFVVPKCGAWTLMYCRSAPCLCASEYLCNLGVRIGDIEEIKLGPSRNWDRAYVLATATVKNAADRIEDNNGNDAK